MWIVGTQSDTDSNRRVMDLSKRDSIDWFSYLYRNSPVLSDHSDNTASRPRF